MADSNEATKKHAEATKKRLAEERAARDKQAADTPVGKPTPTQEECDLAASGVPVTEHEPDGSPPDLGVISASMEPKSASQGSGYQTRTAQPAAPARRHSDT